MTPAVLTEFLLNGLVLGALYVLMALGLSIIFGMVGVINFAHGALFTLGAYTAYQVQGALGFAGALVVAPVLVGILGMLIEATLLRRLYLEDPLQGLLLTFGLAMVLEQGIRLLWGLSPKQFEVPAGLAGALALGSLTYSKYRSFILLAVVLLIVGLVLFLQKTAIGTIVRAGSRDPMMVRLLGISLTPVLTLVFGLGVALAALAGVLSAPLAGVQPAMGVNVVEREGISIWHPARFILVGTMNPEEGDLRPQLLDRFGLTVDVEGIKDIGQRVQIVERREEWESDPAGFSQRFAEQDAEIGKRIAEAIVRFPHVVMPAGILRALAELNVSLQVDGHRADLVGRKASQALAAYRGIPEVGVPEVNEVADMVLAHRVKAAGRRELGSIAQTLPSASRASRS